MKTNPAKIVVELFYDVVSPYAWIAFEVLLRYRPIWTSMDLKLKPVFLGGLIHESGNRSPVFVPNKGNYNFNNDLPRLAKYYDVPIKVPKNPSIVMFEKTSLTAMRFLTAMNQDHPDYTEQLSRELWFRAWSRDQDIYTREDFFEAARDINIEQIIYENAFGQIKDDIIKSKLRAVTTEALNHGAFGVPTIVTHVNNNPEITFGSDRFPILAMIMGEEWKGPNPPIK